MIRRRDDPDPISIAMGADRKAEDMDGIQRSLGRIEGKLDALEASNKKQVEDLDEHKAESREGRSRIYAKVEATNQALVEVKRDLGEVKAKVDTMTETLDKHEKGFKRFNDFEQRFLGVAWFMSGLGLTAGVVVAAAGKWIAAMLWGI